MCGSNFQVQVAEPVVSSIKERIEPVRGDTAWDRGGCLPGVEILCGLSKKLGCAMGWARTFEGTVCANEDNMPEDKRVQWQCI